MRNSIRIILTCIPLFVLGLFLIQLITANNLILHSETLKLVNKRISEIEEQNDYLKTTVTSLSSISRVETQARRMNMVESKNSTAFDSRNFSVAIKR